VERFSGELRIVYASEIFTKRSLALGSEGLRSGWWVLESV
jgi:hypothetical protein